jgi:hypothetical protein
MAADIPMTYDELINNYEYKIVKKMVMREYPWIKNMDIEEDDLNKIESLSVTYFKGISVSYLGNDCYYFEPVLETKNPSFSYKTKKINLQKIEDCYNEEEHFDDDFDTYHAGENPWIDVFGEGDEADAAYWNTD